MGSEEAFRSELRGWVEEHCPASLRSAPAGAERPEANEGDRLRWLSAFSKKGYTTPTWPSEYGGGGLSKDEARVLQEEIARRQRQSTYRASRRPPSFSCRSTRKLRRRFSRNLTSGPSSPSARRSRASAPTRRS